MAKIYRVFTLANDTDVTYSDVSIYGNRTVFLAGEPLYDETEVYYSDFLETIQLTDNFAEEYFPQIFQDKIVWQQAVGDRTTEIFTYDGESISNTTNAGEDILYTNLQGDGESILYVEENLPNGSFKVVFINSNDESVELPITGDPQMDFDFIDIDSERAVWSQRIEGENGITNSQIRLYNGTETVELTNGVGVNVDPKIASDFVVWTQLGNDSEIFLYDGETTTQITDNDINDEGAVVSDMGIVAWTTQEGVFVYQDGNTTRIFDRDVDDSIQLDAGTNDIFIRSDLGLYSYDGEDLNNVVNQSPANFDVSGENIAWDDSGDAVYLAIPYAPNTVFRFLNSDTGVHFYTPNVEEANNIRDNLENYTFEGGSYVGVDPLTGPPEPSSVYRFLNQDTGVHLYTISEVERSAVLELNNYSFEGESFFAYETEVDDSIHVYRFLNSTTGAHFYTSSMAERDNLEANLPNYQSEGIAYYVLPSEI